MGQEIAIGLLIALITGLIAAAWRGISNRRADQDLRRPAREMARKARSEAEALARRIPSVIAYYEGDTDLDSSVVSNMNSELGYLTAYHLKQEMDRIAEKMTPKKRADYLALSNDIDKYLTCIWTRYFLKEVGLGRIFGSGDFTPITKEDVRNNAEISRKVQEALERARNFQVLVRSKAFNRAFRSV